MSQQSRPESAKGVQKVTIATRNFTRLATRYASSSELNTEQGILELEGQARAMIKAMAFGVREMIYTLPRSEESTRRAAKLHAIWDVLEDPERVVDRQKKAIDDSIQRRQEHLADLRRRDWGSLSPSERLAITPPEHIGDY